MTCHDAGWSIWECGSWHSHESLLRDSFRRMRGSLQQGNLLPQYWRQVHLPSLHHTRFSWSSERRTSGTDDARSFRRPPRSDQKTFTVFSVHKKNLRQKWGIAKKLILSIRVIMIGHSIDFVADDSNGTAWRCRIRNNISTIDEAFTDCALTLLLDPIPLWDPWSFQNNWTVVCGSLKSSDSDRYWKVARNFRSASNRPKLSSWGMTPPGFRRLTQFPIISRRTRPTNSTQERPTPKQYGQQ